MTEIADENKCHMLDLGVVAVHLAFTASGACLVRLCSAAVAISIGLVLLAITGTAPTILG